jgi:putative FmdB family regulatory protein
LRIEPGNRWRYDLGMPIYDYKCRACGQQFEELVKLGQTPPCPECGGLDLEKLISLPAVSTDKTRARTMSIARGKAKAIKKEQDHAQAQYERNYIKDHS